MTSRLLRHLWGWRAYFILALTPLLLLPLPIILDNSESRCAYVVILMAVYWVTESLPVGVTALLPVFLFPLLGVVGTNAISATYFNSVNMLFLGGLMMAVAIEYWNLHRRIAIGILMLVGSEPRWIMLGMMLATWFLSMWISNTATTAMMVPITEAILVQLRGTKGSVKSSKRDDSRPGGEDKENGQVANQQELQLYTIDLGEKNGDVIEDKNAKALVGNNDYAGDDGDDEEVEKDDPSFSRMCKGMSLCICYAANSGGIASLTGTGPNLVMKAEADRIYGLVGLSNPVTFGSWMGLGLPLSAIILLVCWIWLQLVYLRCRGLFSCCSKKEQDEETSLGVKAVIRAEYKKLGPVVFGEGLVIVLFILLVVLWITRDMGGVAGWGNLFDSDIKDAVPAILIAVLLFAIPSTIPCIKSYSDPAHPQRQQGRKLGKEEESEKDEPVLIRPLLNWEVVNRKMPWSLFLLLGGGFALSKGCLESGLSAWVGRQLEFFSSWNEWGMMLIICYITAAATEVTSNTAISQLLMPIMSRLAIVTNRHPLFYMFPVTLACSFAFMLPVATPPNAIVFAYGRIKVTDMVAAGSVMNILAVPILVLISGTVGNAIFDFDNVPIEFSGNTTLISTA